MWIWTSTDVNIRPPRLYWYDLRQKKVLGELFDADIPSLSSRDGSLLLVMGSESPESSRPDWLAALLRALGVKLSPPQRTETFWIVDTSRNSVKRVGSLSQHSRSSSLWHSSPDFRRGYTVPSTSMGSALYLCDLEQATLKRIPIHGAPFGWWDDHDILINTAINQFDLLDIKTETTRTLFSPADFDKLLADVASYTTLAGRATVIPRANWNGKSFDFYFGIRDQMTGLKGSNSFVLRASADSPQLTLLYPEFQFRYGGRFDRTGKHYLYPGQTGKPGASDNGAIYLQDLTSGGVSTIVPPATNAPRLPSSTLPRFYGNEVIYLQNNRLHRIGLDGSNDSPVLPVAP
jgi:hypothetical protein